MAPDGTDTESYESYQGLSVASFPLLPASLARMYSVDDHEHRLETARAAVRADPCLMARILAQTRDARPDNEYVAGFGLEELSTEQFLEAMEPADSLCSISPKNDAQKHLWLHSLQVALISEAIAETMAYEGVDGETAYAAGLLHDLGRFVAYARHPELPELIEGHRPVTPEDIMDAESLESPINHSRIGEIVAVEWGLSGRLAVVMDQHHAVTPGADVRSIDARLLSIVRIADLASTLLMADYSARSEEFLRRMAEFFDFTPLDAALREFGAEGVQEVAALALPLSLQAFRKLRLGETAYTEGR